MNPYVEFIQQIETQSRAAKSLPLGGIEPCAAEDLGPDAPTALLFSPHPDDECIIGLLPLRLMREAGMKIINVPITFGSLEPRQAGRSEELKNACDYLGWTVFETKRSPEYSSLEKSDLVELLKATCPKVIVMPHSKDWNSRHIATHFLVMDALAEMEDSFSCTVIETEFWGAMDDPNLMVEADVDTLADLVAATSFHLEEVKRNPYHLSLPSWMMDNVRRGGELVGGQGGAVPDFTFATLYRLRKWNDGKLTTEFEGGRMVSAGANLKKLCNLGD